MALRRCGRVLTLEGVPLRPRGACGLGSCLVGGSALGLGPVRRAEWAGLGLLTRRLTRRSPWQREVDRNQELLTRIRQLQEREAEAEGKMKEQLQRYRVCQQSLDAASKRLRDQEDGLAEAGEVRGWGPGLGCCPLPASSLWAEGR